MCKAIFTLKGGGGYYNVVVKNARTETQMKWQEYFEKKENEGCFDIEANAIACDMRNDKIIVKGL